MDPPEILGPDLAGVIADANQARLDYVVIGGFKRLAGRTQDRADLEALERANGELPTHPFPTDPLPSLDDPE